MHYKPLKRPRVNDGSRHSRKKSKKFDNKADKLKDPAINETVKEEELEEVGNDPVNPLSQLLQTFNSNINEAFSDEENEEDDIKQNSEESDQEFINKLYDESDNAESQGDSDIENTDDDIESEVETSFEEDNSSISENDESENDQGINELDDEYESDYTEFEENSDYENEDDTNIVNKSDSEQNDSIEAGENDHTGIDDENFSDIEENPHENDDVFHSHFQRNLKKEHFEVISDFSNWKSDFQNWNSLGRIKFEYPEVVLERNLSADDTSLPSIGINFNEPDNDFKLEQCHIRPKLHNRLKDIIEEEECPLTTLQNELLTIISNYSDLYYPENTYDKWDNVSLVYCLHSLNHVLKSSNLIISNNSQIPDDGLSTDNQRDQGYTRNKVLIILPFKHTAYRVIKMMMKLMFKKMKQVEVHNKKRFEEDFGPPQDEKEMLHKAEDFKETFKGDISEDFKIGLKITKKSMKLYADFYQSDIIIASPLGLRFTVGVSTDPEYNRDFLSSIEILILDQADIFLMQNWEHILIIMESLNKPPQDIQKITADLMRVRYWMLDAFTASYRQTLIFASCHVDHNRALAAKCINFAGKVQVLNFVECGSVEEIIVKCELFVHRVKGLNNADSRFNYFTQHLLPQLRSDLRNHTMIYVSDYCDYIRLVHYMKDDGGISIATINEYMVSKNSKVAKARSLFFEGARNFLVYTERFHFYRRYKIKGIQHIIFYGLPTYPHFFSELCNMMVDSNQNSREPELLGPHSVSILFQNQDITKLSGVLGSKRAASIAKSDKSIHMCTVGR